MLILVTQFLNFHWLPYKNEPCSKMQQVHYRGPKIIVHFIMVTLKVSVIVLSY